MLIGATGYLSFSARRFCRQLWSVQQDPVASWTHRQRRHMAAARTDEPLKDQIKSPDREIFARYHILFVCSLPPSATKHSRQTHSSPEFHEPYLPYSTFCGCVTALEATSVLQSRDLINHVPHPSYSSFRFFWGRVPAQAVSHTCDESKIA